MSDDHPFPDEFAVAGSSSYYALRFAPREQRSQLALVNAFCRSLLQIPRECSDPGVAETKLRWWREEWERALQGQTQHPLIRRTASLCRRKDVPTDHFAELFRAVEQQIGTGAVKNREQLDILCLRRGSPLTRLLTAAAGGTEEQQSWAEQLGQFIGAAETIRDVGKELRESRCLLPLDALQERGISPANLLSGEQPAPLAALLAEMAAVHRDRYRQTLAGLPREPLPALGPALSLAAMADALLQEIAKEEYRVLHQRIGLTPLTKLWISWRWHRRARRPRGW